jgi:hypothetical protein
MADAPQQPKPIRLWLRGSYVVFGTGLIVLLVVAARLEPAKEGFGTHRGLGLPECSFLVLTGRRCPSCGMTTSWSHWTRGHVLRAVQVNAGGTMLALAATLLGPWMLVSGFRGRYVWFRMNEYVLITAAVSTVFVVLIQWGWRMLV